MKNDLLMKNKILTVTAILAGSLGGGLMFDLFGRLAGDPWHGALWGAVVLSAASILALGVFQGVGQTPAQMNERYEHRIWWRHFGYLAELWRERPLFRAGLGGTYFFTLGGILYLTLVQVGREAYDGGIGSGGLTALMLGLLGLGTVAGHLTAGMISRRGIELGLVPVGCLGIAAGLGLLAVAPGATPWFYAALVGLGFSGGLFLVPLYAFLQDRAGDDRRGRILAAVNVMEGMGGVAAAVAYVGMARWLGLSSSAQFLVLLLPTVLVGLYLIRLLPENFVRTVVRCAAYPFYRFKVSGLENVPAGGAVMIANHLSYIDAVVLQLACPRRLHFVGFDGLRRTRWLQWVFRMFGVIPVAPTRARDAMLAAIERLKAGELVCIFPEGHLSRTGRLMELKKGFSVIAGKAGVPVIPAYMDGLWGSVFSFRGGRFFWKIPRRLRYPVDVSFGPALAPERADPDRARRALLDLGEAAFSRRPELRRHLGRACVGSLSRSPGRTAFVDRTADRKEVSAGKLLAVSAVLSGHIRDTVPERRVGIVLPPGVGGAIANLAVVLAGKVPVNLNFTSGRSAIESSIEQAGIHTIVTASAMKAKAGDFPWTDRTLDLAEAIGACGKPAIFGWLVAVWTMPAPVVATLLKLPIKGDREEAGLLFTSGSSGLPKGVVLSHRNVLANVMQMEETGMLSPNDTILASLPLFHSFGFTVTLWCALLNRMKVATVPSPLDARRIARVIGEEKATVHVGTPTFLRALMKKAEPGQLRSLRRVVSGAEKLPEDLSEAFRERFGVGVLQGYGLTETSPVAAVNVEDPATPKGLAGPQTGSRSGSVGRLLPGMSARIVSPDDGRELSLEEEGMLQLKGDNVFEGYLNDAEKTGMAFAGDWFVTGDLARFDRDGFLKIEGRLSRFSKIGGEMVPHGRIEEAVVEAFEWEGSEEPAAAVTGVPDADKGEALVLLCTRDISAGELRRRLSAIGLPNLWIPRCVIPVPRIPLLGTGKLDLKGCRDLAETWRAELGSETAAVAK